MFSGTLTIEIKRGKLDYSSKQFRAKISPYVFCQIGQNIHSSGIDHTHDKFPIWNDTLTFSIHSDMMLDLKVIDRNLIYGEDMVGEAYIQLQPVYQRLQLTNSFSIRKNGLVTGQVELTLQFTPYTLNTVSSTVRGSSFMDKSLIPNIEDSPQNKPDPDKFLLLQFMQMYQSAGIASFDPKKGEYVETEDPILRQIQMRSLAEMTKLYDGKQSNEASTNTSILPPDLTIPISQMATNYTNQVGSQQQYQPRNPQAFHQPMHSIVSSQQYPNSQIRDGSGISSSLLGQPQRVMHSHQSTANIYSQPQHMPVSHSRQAAVMPSQYLR